MVSPPHRDGAGPDPVDRADNQPFEQFKRKHSTDPTPPPSGATEAYEDNPEETEESV